MATVFFGPSFWNVAQRMKSGTQSLGDDHIGLKKFGVPLKKSRDQVNS
jgi:hypothetical protein